MKEKIILLILSLLLLSSCKLTEHKAKRQLVNVEAEYSYLFANHCNRLYPVRERVEIETEYIPGKTDTIPGETKYVNCADSANQGQNVAIPCPPSYHRVDTSKVIERIEKESSAKLEMQRKEYQAKEAANIRLIAELNLKLLQAEEELAFYHKIRRWVLWLGGACLAIWLLFQLKSGWIKIIVKFIKNIF